MAELPTLLMLHLMDLQSQMERQTQSLRKVLYAVADGRSAAAVVELNDIITRSQQIAETASDARTEVASEDGNAALS